MGGVALEVTLEDGGLGDALAGMIARAEDMTPAMDEIGAVLTTSTQLRFETGKGPGGQAWTPSIRAAAEGGLTLVDRGSLRDSIVHRASAQEVEVGSNLVYARIHQLGGKAGRGKKTTLPARPYLGLSDSDQDRVRLILARFIGRAGA